MKVPPPSSKLKRALSPTANNDEPTRKKKRADEAAKLEPEAIIAYNNGKCGIDKSDRMASYSTCNRRGVKWNRKVFFESLTGMSMVNAFNIYKEHTNSKSNINKFREDVARTLLFGNYANRKSLMIPKVAHLFKKTDEKTRKQCRTCYINLTKEMSRAEARKKALQVIAGAVPIDILKEGSIKIYNSSGENRERQSRQKSQISHQVTAKMGEHEESGTVDETTDE
ncbi:hypothetical protein JTB14_013131 [Gonioctena quinquepunctata]|nr:hypothetical protein JTB14_013131 [Gonioctena quinquepunctata]